MIKSRKRPEIISAPTLPGSSWLSGSDYDLDYWKGTLLAGSEKERRHITSESRPLRTAPDATGLLSRRVTLGGGFPVVAGSVMVV